jgi:hypothetical protein
MISLTDRVRNVVFHRVKEDRNILIRVEQKKLRFNWIGVVCVGIAF